MTICYRNEGGCVYEEMDFDAYELREINFRDGFAYFSIDEEDADGFKIERKIPIDALVSIIY